MQNTLLLKTNSACKTSGGWEGLITHRLRIFQNENSNSKMHKNFPENFT